MRSKSFLFLILIFLSLSLSYAVTFPNYSLENKYVTDTVGIIDSNYGAQITNLCAGIEKSTGAQIAVVIINSTEELSIEEYALRLFEKWGIGEKDKDNGLLILIAIEDREYRIEVGYGLEGILNDAKVGRLAREFFVDNFRAGNYGEGIYLAVDTIGKELGGEYTIITDEREMEPIETAIALLVVLLPMIFLAIVAAIDKKRGKKSSFANMLLWFLIFSMLGRGRGRSGGGGFGGFGGGRSGGGGASGGW